MRAYVLGRPSICLSTCVFVCPFVRLHIYLSVRVHVSATRWLIIRVCVHQCMRSHVCIRACRGRMCESVRLSACLPACMFVRPSSSLLLCPCACSCVQMFDRTCVRLSMQTFACSHARVTEGVCVSPCVRMSVRLCVCT